MQKDNKLICSTKTRMIKELYDYPHEIKTPIGINFYNLLKPKCCKECGQLICREVLEKDITEDPQELMDAKDRMREYLNESKKVEVKIYKVYDIEIEKYIYESSNEIEARCILDQGRYISSSIPEVQATLDEFPAWTRSISFHYLMIMPKTSEASSVSSDQQA